MRLCSQFEYWKFCKLLYYFRICTMFSTETLVGQLCTNEQIISKVDSDICCQRVEVSWCPTVLLFSHSIDKARSSLHELYQSWNYQPCSWISSTTFHKLPRQLWTLLQSRWSNGSLCQMSQLLLGGEPDAWLECCTKSQWQPSTSVWLERWNHCLWSILHSQEQWHEGSDERNGMLCHGLRWFFKLYCSFSSFKFL